MNVFCCIVYYKYELMKIKINSKQFQLLTSNFHIIEGNGLSENGKNIIKESRLTEYVVRIYIHGMLAEIRIGAYSSVSAISIARHMFTKAIITGHVTTI